MTNITRSPEAVDREFTQKFDGLVAKVFGEDVVKKRVFGWELGLHCDFGYFKGWNLYKITKRPILWGLFTPRSELLVGRINTNVDREIVAEVVVYEERVQRYRPSSIHLDDPTFLETTKRFAEAYRTLFDVNLPIQTNF